MTPFRVNTLLIFVNALIASLLVLAENGAAQPLAERPDQGFVSPGVRYTLADVARVCLTRLNAATTAAVREPTCVVADVQLIGSREGTRWYAAQYRRSALAEWTEKADSMEWDELVLLRSPSGADSIVPVWYIRTERMFEFVSGVKAQLRQDVLLIEVLLCLNGTGGCSRNYLVESSAGLEYVSMPFADQLSAQLSDGKQLHKGMTLDLETLRGSWPVAGPGDANCCPSEVFDYALRLEDAQLILVNAALRPARESPHH